MNKDTRIIDLTVSDLTEIITIVCSSVINNSLSDQKNEEIKNKTFKIAELEKLNLVGKYRRIKTLISHKDLILTTDGRITGESIFNYINKIKPENKYVTLSNTGKVISNNLNKN